MSKLAKLRCCASCMWIFKTTLTCPRCSFASYGARFIFGNKAYKYAKTQEPWMKRKLDKYADELLDIIENENKIPDQNLSQQADAPSSVRF